MSLVFPSREVAAGPTVGLKGQAAAVAEAAAAAAAPVGCGGLPVYLRVGVDKWRAPGDEGVGSKVAVVGRGGFGLGGGIGGCMAASGEEAEKDAVSSESSSIGEAGDSSLSLSSSTAEGDGEEEEVQSKLKEDALASLDSLEESLPIKRGLSNCFSGKSKSFANLSEAAALGTAVGLAKSENPFNKRRRILMASKASWQRRASYAALNTTSSLWALEEDQEYHDGAGAGANDGKLGGGDGGAGPGAPELPTPSPPRPVGRKHVKTFKAARSFSLTDLQHA
ncbi:hypothetical protein Taro_011224 [Colocasia esculenta]|uniref:Uncharacterized protein n=1 Tax=Colocasia esculenta TaxID=4460 RepID=A0A843UAB0_COLES|nr:hypothetical protein [Colocasia esculenta]